MANPTRLSAKLTELEQHGAGVYRVRMRPEGRVPRFRAGQFLHLSLDAYDPTSGFWPESRVFSIASSNSENEIEIVYSVKGKYTRLMETQLKLGRTVSLKLPYGSFIIDRLSEGRKKVVLVAGGTGVSPFIPFVRDSLESESGPNSRDTVLHYGVRSASMLLYQDLLENAAAGLGQFSLKLWSEEVAPDFGNPANAGGNTTDLRYGRLDPSKILEEEGHDGVVYFLSGPPPMLDVFRRALSARGVSDENIQIDEWE